MGHSFKPGTKEVMALEADYVDENLNTFLKSLITAYSRIPWAMDTPVNEVNNLYYNSKADELNSAVMRAQITPAGTRQDTQPHSLTRLSRGMIIQIATLLMIQRVLVDFPGRILSNLQRFVLLLSTKWLSDMIIMMWSLYAVVRDAGLR